MLQADRDWVRDCIAQSAASMAAFAADEASHATLAVMAETTVASFRAGGKLLIAGNGGSAGDAQHIAAEFTGRLLYDRPPLPAVALTTDSSALTAIGNDYGFDLVFDRQVRALGRPGDVFLGISTSGNSPNVLAALRAARALGMTTYGFSGASGGQMQALCDLNFRAPGSVNIYIQQVHITAAHLLCAIVERTMFPRESAAAA